MKLFDLFFQDMEGIFTKVENQDLMLAMKKFDTKKPDEDFDDKIASLMKKGARDEKEM